jgi:hypothetical protein
VEAFDRLMEACRLHASAGSMATDQFLQRPCSEGFKSTVFFSFALLEKDFLNLINF